MDIEIKILVTVDAKGTHISIESGFDQQQTIQALERTIELLNQNSIEATSECRYTS